MFRNEDVKYVKEGERSSVSKENGKCSSCGNKSIYRMDDISVRPEGILAPSLKMYFHRSNELFIIASLAALLYRKRSDPAWASLQRSHNANYLVKSIRIRAEVRKEICMANLTAK